jgi:N-acetylglucosaminyldiphosphoundecaprenol N-acetyl-beta-D-mannosaminyltransferase
MRAAYGIIGTSIDLVSPAEVLNSFDHWLGDAKDRFVVFRDVHGVITARNNKSLQNAHTKADLVVADGKPLVWISRLAGKAGIARVAGPDFMLQVCQMGLTRQWTHFFYGATPAIMRNLEAALKDKFPAIKIVGTYCPPFRPLTVEEDESACCAIRKVNPDFVWVGLGTPKQEIWMAEHCGKLGGRILLGVGAAFNIHAGAVRRAPEWLQSLGLEWLFRVVCEPKRLWRRYLKIVPLFLLLASLELVKALYKLKFGVAASAMNIPATSGESHSVPFAAKRPPRHQNLHIVSGPEV